MPNKHGNLRSKAAIAIKKKKKKHTPLWVTFQISFAS